MKHGLLFSTVSLALLHRALTSGGVPAKALCFYVALGCAGLGLSYFLNRPQLLLKRPDGRLRPWSYLLYAPCHGLNYLVLALFRWIGNKPIWTEIVPGLYLGGRLRPSDQASFTARGPLSVLDLTAEFAEAEWLRAAPAYRCIPLLDATAPDAPQLAQGLAFIQERLVHGPVYVHCAFGHGRSATFVVGYLVASGHSQSVEEALAFAQSKRRGVLLNPAQLKSLETALAGRASPVTHPASTLTREPSPISHAPSP